MDPARLGSPAAHPCLGRPRGPGRVPAHPGAGARGWHLHPAHSGAPPPRHPQPGRPGSPRSGRASRRAMCGAGRPAPPGCPVRPGCASRQSATPSRSELARPATGVGLTTRTSSRQSMRSLDGRRVRTQDHDAARGPPRGPPPARAGGWDGPRARRGACHPRSGCRPRRPAPRRRSESAAASGRHGITGCAGIRAYHGRRTMHPSTTPGNRLAAETSPYLLQHAHDPVDWHAWGPDALALARDARPARVPVRRLRGMPLVPRDAPRVVLGPRDRPGPQRGLREHQGGPGGATGRRCPVHGRAPGDDGRRRVADERVPDPGRAALPRWDLLPGHAPPRRTCLPTGAGRRQRRVAGASRRGRGRRHAGSRRRSLRASARCPSGHRRATHRGGRASAALDRATATLIERFDERIGAWGGAPLFPQPMVIEHLLRESVRTGNERALAVARRALDAMAAGGIRDHLAGGFARYATDARWLVPHFEKMLYDNAQLALAYLHAWQATGEPRYREVVDRDPRLPRARPAGHRWGRHRGPRDQPRCGHPGCRGRDLRLDRSRRCVPSWAMPHRCSRRPTGSPRTGTGRARPSCRGSATMPRWHATPGSARTR